jgi:uncharacterized protein YkwD
MNAIFRPALALAVAAACVGPLAGCAGVFGQAQKKAADAAAPVSLNAEEAAVLAETNKVREAHGLGALRPDAELVSVARARSRDMAKRSYFGHVTPEGRSVFTVMRDYKMVFGAAGENIAKKRAPAAVAPAQIVGDWAKTPAQRANLLQESFGRVGIGAVRTSDGQVYVTQILAD